MINLPITQNCISRQLYMLSNCQYETPFINTVIDFKSMKYLIEHWNDINFYNYELVKDSQWNFSIIIDEKVKIQYVHYKFSATAKTLMVKDDELYYNKIWEFIIEKYESRLKRMQASKKLPVFILTDTLSLYKDAIYTNEQLKELSKYKNVIIFYGMKQYTIPECAKIIHSKLFQKDF